jgi:hypothetical protein
MQAAEAATSDGSWRDGGGWSDAKRATEYTAE